MLAIFIFLVLCMTGCGIGMLSCCSQVANALECLGLQQGDAIAIDMPMNVYAVTAYLAIILAGFVVVSIADSFCSQRDPSSHSNLQSKGYFYTGQFHICWLQEASLCLNGTCHSLENNSSSEGTSNTALWLFRKLEVKQKESIFDLQTIR